MIIFYHKEAEVPMTWKTGINITVESPNSNVKVEIDVELKISVSKKIPKWPKCKYSRKVVCCLSFASESGGIIDPILVKRLEYFDGLELVERNPGGIIPCLPQLIDFKNLLLLLTSRLTYQESALVFHMQLSCGKCIETER